MFEEIFFPRTAAKYRATPLVGERERYLVRLKETGATRPTLRKCANDQLNLVSLLNLQNAERVKLGAMRTGDRAIKIGHGGDHRWPGLGGRTIVRAIIAARMMAQRARIMDGLDTGMTQIGRNERAPFRLRHGDQLSRSLWRSSRDGCAGER